MKKFVSVIAVLALLLGVCSFGASAQGKFLYGDVDADGAINSSDALYVLQHSTKIKVLKTSQQAIADVNLDGNVNSSDALDILRFSVGLSKEFEKDYSKTLKYNKVDKVIDSGVYTVKTTSIIDGRETTLIFTSNGKEQALSTTVKINIREMLSEAGDAGAWVYLVPSGETPIEIRFYTNEQGKSYLLFPMFKMYCEIDEEDTPDELIEILFGEENLYDSREQSTVSGKSVVTETYISDANSKLKYKFSNENLVNVVLSDSKENKSFDIEKFSATADSSLLEIPKGYSYSKELANTLGY